MVDWAPADFWKYWAITVPLTIVVMGIWAVYMITVDKQNRKKTGEAQDILRKKLNVNMLA